MPPLRTVPARGEELASRILAELLAKQDVETDVRGDLDIVDWAQQNFYIPATSEPIRLLPHQRALLRYAWKRNEEHHYDWTTFIYSTVKQSGKSTVAGVCARYMAETQARYGNVVTVGNDLDQAKGRAFQEARYSIELTPGFAQRSGVLPMRWMLKNLSMICLNTGTSIKAVAVDAKGEAGGKNALSVWTELWGFDTQDAVRFWDEMTPVPTIPDSLRLVETYAGYDGESKLLYDLYSAGREGHQLTAGELASASARDEQEFALFVNAWHETNGDPRVKIPVYHNKETGILMYWDEGDLARRMPWQSGERGEQYYREQAASLPEKAYRRFHYNEWVGAESQFVPLESWDLCGNVHPIEPLVDGDRTMIVVGVDAAVTGDCFGIVAVSRCPIDHTAIDVRAIKKYDPRDNSDGTITFAEPEAFLRAACAVNNVVQIAYDPYQLESMMQKFRADTVAWCESFNQGHDRLVADRQLYDLIMARKLHHSHEVELREHIINANAKVQRDEDSKLRIVKKKAGGKIDLSVALSMASSRCLYLRL